MEIETETSTSGSSEEAISENFSDEIEEDLPEEPNAVNNKHSIIREIQEEISSVEPKINGAEITKSSSFSKSKELAESTDKLDVTESSTKEINSRTGSSNETINSSTAASGVPEEEASSLDDYLHDKDWLTQKKHVFILSSAGKPIYSLHGNEDKLVTIFGVMQALVSFIQTSQDSIISIHANGLKFVFLVRNFLILVAVSRTNLSVHQLQMQLNDVYNQILSTLTYSHITTIFDKRKNFDLRRLLAGSERLIDHLLINDSSHKRITNNVFTFLTNSIRVLPLNTNIRSNIINAIQSNCSKIKDLVFAVLIANNKLITLVRMNKYSIHPADLRLIFNLIECSESFKTAESWTPICLPKFDPNGYLHAHVSYLAEDCQACLLLLSVDRTVFFTLSEAKKKITERLRRTQCLEAINKEMNNHGVNLDKIGISEIRHFMYKPKNNSQLLCSELRAPYDTISEFERLEAIYCDMHQKVHNGARPLKLIYEIKANEVILAWVTTNYELYAVFEPTVDKTLVIKLVDKLVKWIEKEEEIQFIKNHPTF